MSIDEDETEKDKEEGDFEEWEEDDKCESCRLSFDLCSWGQCDQYGSMDYTNYNVIRPIQDDDYYTDLDSNEF